MLLFLIGILGFGFYISKKHIKMLEECSKESIAIVLSKYNKPKKNNTLKYSYLVQGKTYITNESIDDEYFNYFEIGDSILILYSCEDPNVSTLGSPKIN